MTRGELIAWIKDSTTACTHGIWREKLNGRVIMSLLCDHSDCAALFGFCECEECQEARERDRDDCHEVSFSGVRLGRESEWKHFCHDMQQHPTEEWHLWTIRSWHLDELRKHREEMAADGYTVGPLRISEGWAIDAHPVGMGIFSCRILADQYTDEMKRRACEWDQKYGSWDIDYGMHTEDFGRSAKPRQ